MRGGANLYRDEDFALALTSLTSSGVPNFTTVTTLGDVVGDLSAGVTFLAPPGAIFSTNTSVTLSYDGRFGENFDEGTRRRKASSNFTDCARLTSRKRRANLHSLIEARGLISVAAVLD